MRSITERRFDFSGGVQSASNWLLRAQNEIEDVTNGRFNDEIGRIARRLGYTAIGNDVVTGKAGLGLFEAKFSNGAVVFAATNKSDDTATEVRKRNNDGTWTLLSMPTALARDTEINMCTSLDNAYIAGKSSNTGARMKVVNVKNDLTLSETRNLIGAPKARFICEYGGRLHAMNVELNSVVYADRDYISSPALSTITFVRGAQIYNTSLFNFINNVPLMTSDTAPAGTASASSVFAAGREAYKVFDGDGTTSWAPTSTTGWVRYDFGASNTKTITYYSLRARNDGGNIVNSPKDWTFEGSNDGSTWTTIHTVTNEPAWYLNEKRIYSSPNTNAYRYYRVNISAVQTGGTNLVVGEFELLTTGTITNSLPVDSARYLKPGMAIDIYDHITGTVKYSNLTIVSVDKSNDTIVLPNNTNNLNFATSDVNTSTDTITLSSTTNYPTGTAVSITSTTSVPSGLSLNTTYYVINTGATSIKLAASLEDAKASTAINITSTGSGTHTININYVTADNDEIYLTGRYGELYYLWNTDYPTADKADYLKIPSGASSNSEIIGYGKSNNRLFLFTDTTTHRYDQSQLVPIFEDIGVANHQTIRNVGDWLIWLDNDKRVIARNDSTGQMEFISRAIKKKYLKDVPLANLATAAAGSIDNVYKLSLGTVNGKALRVVYDFDSNNWSRDEYIREFRRHIVSSAAGSTKALYMLTDNGKFVQDEVGNDDDGDAIPLIVRYGRNHYGTAAEKNLVGMYVFGENISGGEVRIYKNGDTQNPRSIGKLTENISVVTPGQKDVAGRDLNIEIAITGKGDPPAIDGHETHLTAQEDKFDGTK